mgnify:CR=1 FL=1
MTTQTQIKTFIAGQPEARRGDMQALLNYRSLAPHAERAHPTEDHFLPLFFALGAAGDDLHANYLSREVMYSMLAMDAFSLHPVH